MIARRMALVLVRTIAEARVAVRRAKREGKRVGFVPTMGYLHEGHLRLVDLCRERADYCAVSVFVNPAQFGPGEDYERYPRDLERDRRLLEARGVDLLFAPSVEEMYPEPPLIRFQIEKLADHLCGPRRPGHFPGVLLVVTKLFHILEPDVAVFGQKDLQQLVIVKRLVRDLNFPVEIVAGPTVREPDGLAMSSRNEYLSPKEREKATVLYRALQRAKALVEGGERSAAAVLAAMRDVIERVEGVRLDYVEAVELETLQPVERLEGRVALAVAAFVGPARLIDNLVLDVRDGQVREVPAID